MYNLSISFLLLFCSLLLSSCGTTSIAGETKIEEEYRISPQEAPEAAVQYVQAVFQNQPARWYLERGAETTTIEAKVRWQGRQHSVEFEESGKLQDVEILIAPTDIPAEAFAAISEELDKLYQNYTIERMQRQLTGNPEVIKNALLEQPSGDKYTVRYELVVKGRTEKGTYLYEHLFAVDGKLLDTAQIIIRNTDILNF